MFKMQLRFLHVPFQTSLIQCKIIQQAKFLNNSAILWSISGDKCLDDIKEILLHIKHFCENWS